MPGWRWGLVYRHRPAPSRSPQRVDQIAVSAREQATGLGEINSAVTDLDAITQQNAAVFEETAAAAGTLTQSAEEMKRLTDAFKNARAAQVNADRAA